MVAQPEPRKTTDPWLVFTLNDQSKKLETLSKEVKAINGSLRDEIARSRLADSVHDQQIERQKERLEEHKKTHNNPGNPGNSNSPEGVTFKWIVDKLGAPVVTGVITAILVAAIVLLVTGNV